MEGGDVDRRTLQRKRAREIVQQDLEEQKRIKRREKYIEYKRRTEGTSGSKKGVSFEEDENSHKYRDRARERREGKNVDYSNANATLRAAVGIVQGEGDANATEEAMAMKLSVEESKFLGGDMEHTHLVKGLDYSLLSSIRQELEEKDEKEREERERAEKALSNAQNQEKIHRGAFGKAIYRATLGNVVSREESVKSTELFHPGRSTFRFSLDPSESGFNVPTMLIRPKDEVEEEEGRVCWWLSGDMLEDACRTLAQVRHGGKKIRRKKKKEAPSLFPLGSGAGASSEPAEDIFADAGSDYVCEPSAAPAQTTATKQYFTNAGSAPEDVLKAAQEEARQAHEGLRVFAQREAEKALEDKRRALEERAADEYTPHLL